MITFVNVSKDYALGGRDIHALRDVNLHIARGEFVAVVGPSGSGKSTLLHVMGCLDGPDDGQYRFDGMDVAAISQRQLAQLRNRRVGFVFQGFNLIDSLTAQQNVEQPMLYGGVARSERRLRAQALLAQLDLAERAHHRPSQLSGGQQQRVAIARALANNPEVIIADEPTGNLDSATARDILALLQALHQCGKTLVLVTHSEEIASQAGRLVRMRDGTIEHSHD